MVNEKDLILKAKTGDNISIEELMERYIPLVNKIARKYFLIGAGMDDIVQEGMVGLYKAILSYNMESCATFKTFSTLCITRQIQSAVKLANRNKNLPLNTCFSINNQGMVVISSANEKDNDEDEGIYIPSTTLSPEEKMLSQERIKEMNDEIEKVLSDFEKKVIKLYISGKNYIEIAKIINKDPKSIDNALNRIKIKLKFLRG